MLCSEKQIVTLKCFVSDMHTCYGNSICRIPHLFFSFLLSCFCLLVWLLVASRPSRGLRVYLFIESVRSVRHSPPCSGLSSRGVGSLQFVQNRRLALSGRLSEPAPARYCASFLSLQPRKLLSRFLIITNGLERKKKLFFFLFLTKWRPRSAKE